MSLWAEHAYASEGGRGAESLLPRLFSKGFCVCALRIKLFIYPKSPSLLIVIVGTKN